VALGSAARQLTFEGNNNAPVFSPDGTRIAFTSTREGTAGSDIFVKNLDDDSPPRSVGTLEGNQLLTQWPSDTLMLYESSGDLGMVDLSDPDNPRPSVYLSAEGATLFDLLVSPDGRLAAYRSNESGTNEIYVRSFPDPGERTVISTTGGAVPFWSSDGTTLYYWRLETPCSGTMFAARLRLEPVPTVLATDSLFAGPYCQPFSGTPLHPDGDRWVLQVDLGSEVPRTLMVTNFFEELRRLAPN
jgi:WD40 repeat protein